MASKSKANLVIATVGDESLHGQWLAPREQRSFDVMLVYYGTEGERYRQDGEYYSRERGMKWPLIASVSTRFAQEIAAYDAIWCPDDDLAIDTADVDAMFDLFHRLDLKLAQPALAEGSHVWFQITRQCPYATARYVDLIEPGAPLFSRETFELLEWTFGESESGWGLDLLWGRLLAYDRMAVLHAVAVTHTRPYFAGASYRGQRPLHDAKRLIQKFGMRQELHAGDAVFSTVLRPDATDYISRLFEQDLPEAFRRNAAEVAAIGVRFQLTIAGFGEWIIDASSTTPSCRPGRAEADCTFEFASTGALFRYLEAPRRRMVDLFLANELEILGRQTHARKLPRVFEVLFPYRHTDIEFV